MPKVGILLAWTETKLQVASDNWKTVSKDQDTWVFLLLFRTGHQLY